VTVNELENAEYTGGQPGKGSSISRAQAEGRIAGRVLFQPRVETDVLARTGCRLEPTEGTQPAAVPNNRAGEKSMARTPRQTNHGTEICSKAGHIDGSWHCSR
jgi:hypothetical protein